MTLVNISIFYIILNLVYLGEDMTIIEEVIENNKYLINNKIENYEFSDCVFNNCNFEETTFINCKFNECVFNNCKFINPKFINTFCRNMTVNKCYFLGINWQTISTSFNRTLAGICLEKVSNCFFRFCYFFDLNMNKLNLSFSEFDECEFESCDCKKVNFENAKFKNTKFLLTNLSQSNFVNAQGYYVDITTCKLKGAKFSKPEVINLLYSTEIEIVE